MLRHIVLALGGAMLVTAVLALFAGQYPLGLFFLVWGGIMAFGIVYERYAYKNLVDVPPSGKHWVQTMERFIDKESGRAVVVYYNSWTGERAYVALPAS